MPIFQYRLATLLEQKEAHQQECEKELAERKAARRQAKAALVALLQQQSDREHELRQLRGRPLPTEATGDDWQARAGDIQIGQQRVEGAKDDVFSQQLLLEDLEQQVTQAAGAVQRAAREVETLKKHRTRSERQFLAALERKQTQEQEEIAATMYQNRRRA